MGLDHSVQTVHGFLEEVIIKVFIQMQKELHVPVLLVESLSLVDQHDSIFGTLILFEPTDNSLVPPNFEVWNFWFLMLNKCCVWLSFIVKEMRSTFGICACLDFCNEEIAHRFSPWYFFVLPSWLACLDDSSILSLINFGNFKHYDLGFFVLVWACKDEIWAVWYCSDRFNLEFLTQVIQHFFQFVIRSNFLHDTLIVVIKLNCIEGDFRVFLHVISTPPS